MPSSFDAGSFDEPRANCSVVEEYVNIQVFMKSGLVGKILGYRIIFYKAIIPECLF
jgi:hypothetical protein